MKKVILGLALALAACQPMIPAGPVSAPIAPSLVAPAPGAPPQVELTAPAAPATAPAILRIAPVKAAKVQLDVKPLVETSTFKPADIKVALSEVFGLEGGLQCDKHDPGNRRPDGTYGCTKFGIAANSYPELDIPHLTLIDAGAIYDRDFWLPMGLNRINVAGPNGKIKQAIANLAFQTAICQGEGTEVRTLQRAINLLNGNAPDIAVNGRVDACMLTMINDRLHPMELYTAMMLLTGARYIDLAEKNPKKYGEFYRSWQGRLPKPVVK